MDLSCERQRVSAEFGEVIRQGVVIVAPVQAKTRGASVAKPVAYLYISAQVLPLGAYAYVSTFQPCHIHCIWRFQVIVMYNGIHGNHETA
jgi:hypothetical protein